MKRVGLGLVAAGALAGLSACQGGTDTPPADPEPGAEPSEAPAPVSILRPDVEQPAQAQAALDPLTIRIGFPEGGNAFDEAALEALEQALASEQLAAGGAIVLRSHTDASGSDRVNARASQQRGDAVRDWLVERGISDERITVIAFGEQNPIEPNALPDGSPNEAGRAANRRVELTITPPGTGSAQSGEEASPAPSADPSAGAPEGS